MRSYLLFHVLILGIVESQTVNRTDGEVMRPDQPGSQTFNLSTKVERNVTSTLYADELSEIEGELGLQNNETFNLITEDDENFQDQEEFFPPKFCHEDLLVEHSHSFCGAQFHADMLTIEVQNWCDLKYIIGPYNNMTICMERLSSLVGCYYPNPNVQEFFLHIHSQYFQNCSEEELQLADAPHGVVVALTLIPVGLIPILVFLVVWKSKVRE